MTMSADYRQPPVVGSAVHPRRRRRTLQWAATLLSLALLPVLIWMAAPTLAESRDALSRIAPGWFVAAFLLEVIARGALAEVYRATLHALGGRLSHSKALDIAMGSFTVSRVVPGGGAVGAAFAARRLTHFGTRGTIATASVLLSNVMLMVTLAVIVAIAAIVLWFAGRLAPIWLTVLAAPTVLVAIAVLVARVLWRSPARRTRVRSIVERLAGRFRIDLDTLRLSAHHLRGEKGGVTRLAPVIAWSAVNWLTDAGALWMIFLGLGQEVRISVLLVGYGAANIATAIPITPGGLGVVEAGTAAAFTALGVPAAAAVVAVIGYRVMSHWLPMAVGVVPYLRAVRTEHERAAAAGTRRKSSRRSVS